MSVGSPQVSSCLRELGVPLSTELQTVKNNQESEGVLVSSFVREKEGGPTQQSSRVLSFLVRRGVPSYNLYLTNLVRVGSPQISSCPREFGGPT